MIIRISAAAISLALSACGLTPEGDMVRTVIRERGADASDALFANTVWTLCNPMPIGAVVRAIGDDVELMNAYNRLCLGRRTRLSLLPQ